MDEPRGHQCPECGALRARDNTPSCACTQRAADALRDARTAEAAAAEDFDPLRIRPYVEIEGGAEDGGEGRPHGADGHPRGVKGQAPAAPDATMPLRAVSVDPVGPLEGTAALPTPLAAPSGAPDVTDLSLFESAPGASDLSDDDAYAESGRPHRHRRTALLGVTAAVVAVVAAAGYASGLFSYETPSRDGAPPKDVRAAVPAPSTSTVSTPPPSAPRPAPPSPTPTTAPPSAVPSTSPSPSPSASSASPSASLTAPEPTPTAPTVTATSSLRPENNAARQDDAVPAALRQGDRGPEVAELQQRLRQLRLHDDDIDGNYDSQVENAVRNYQWSHGIQDDEPGVYGPATRTALESETKEP